MDEVLAYLKECGTYYLATLKEGKPDVRPFGTISKFEDKLYFQSGRAKDVYAQMLACPDIAISADNSNGSWLRIHATAVEDPRVEANKAILDEYPELAPMYKPDDGNCVVFYLKDAEATFYSFTEEPKTVTF